MSDVNSFSRQWQLLRMLCRRHAQLTLRDMSQELQVSSKTITRDLETLRGVGFPIQETIGFRGLKLWCCQTESILAGLTLTFEEATALYLGRRFLEPLAGTALWEGSQSAYRKIRAGFGEKTLNYLEKLASVIYLSNVGLSDYSNRSQIIDTIMIALEDSRPVSLLYHSINSDSPTEVIIHPHGIVYHRTALYIVAFVPVYEELRHYKVDRIRDAELLTEESFTRIKDFDLNQHFAATFGVFHGNGTLYQIEICFDADASRYVEEHHWHESQQLTKHTDGTATLTLQLSSLEEIKSWIMSFGAKAKVISPEELREMIRKDVETLSAEYRSSTKQIDDYIQENR